MKLSHEQIQYIDHYLQFLGVNFIDIRSELIDHLASEFENSADKLSLEDFLKTKGKFVRNFQKQWHNTKHWCYQKALLIRVVRFLITPRYILVSLFALSGIYTATHSFSRNWYGFFFLATIVIPQIVLAVLYNRPKGMYKQIQSAQYMLSIMALPSMFLYLFGGLSEWLRENPTCFISYWFFALIFNLAGLQEVISCRNQILRHYKYLIRT